MTGISESMLEATCLDWLDELGWTRIHGPDSRPGLRVLTLHINLIYQVC